MTTPYNPWRDPKQWRAAFWVGVVGVGALAAWITYDQTASPMRPRLELQRWGWAGKRTLTAELRNASSDPIRYAEIRWTVFTRGVQVGTAMTNTTDLGPGVTWRATAPVLEADADSAAVAAVTAR
jgi:hypothetical protein